MPRYQTEPALEWFDIFDCRPDGRKGGLVFNSRANSVEDAHSQVKGHSWPFGFVIQEVATGECHEFPSNDPRRAAFLRSGPGYH